MNELQKINKNLHPVDTIYYPVIGRNKIVISVEDTGIGIHSRDQ